jgi:septum site-determining protein MinC
VLDRHGLAVVGVNGTPKELEEEASQGLGLPALWSSNRPAALKCELEDIVQMVVRRQQEQPIKDEEEEFLERQEDAFESTTTIKDNSVENDSSDTPGVVADKDAASTEQAIMPQQLPPISPAATIYQGTVRSGQQVWSEKGCSLVILGSVSSGGEVLSDGDIMVLGKLRGRALAGLSAPTARIIATSMDPELVSVGGVLSTGDRVNEVVSGAPSMVSLNDQKELVFQKIAIG